MRKLFLFIVVACLVITSCEKDEPENNITPTEQKKEPTFLIQIRNNYYLQDSSWYRSAFFYSNPPSIIPSVKFNEYEIPYFFHSSPNNLTGRIKLPLDSPKEINIEVSSPTDTTSGVITIPDTLTNLRFNGNPVSLLNTNTGSYSFYPDSMISLEWEGNAEYYSVSISGSGITNIGGTRRAFSLDTSVVEENLQINLNTRVDSFKFIDQMTFQLGISCINGNDLSLPGESPLLTGSYGDGYVYATTKFLTPIRIIYEKTKSVSSGVKNGCIELKDLPIRDDLFELYKSYLVNNSLRKK